MPLGIENTNTYVMRRVLSDATQASADAAWKITTGERLRYIYEDVAAASIGKQLESEQALLNKLITSVTEGQAVLGLASAGIQNVQSIVEQLRELTTTASAGTVEDAQRQMLDIQFQGLLTQWDRVVSSTEFNGLHLLDGTLAAQSNAATDISGITSDVSTGLSAISQMPLPADADLTAARSFEINGVRIVLADNAAVANLALDFSAAITDSNTIMITSGAESILFRTDSTAAAAYAPGSLTVTFSSTDVGSAAATAVAISQVLTSVVTGSASAAIGGIDITALNAALSSASDLKTAFAGFTANANAANLAVTAPTDFNVVGTSTSVAKASINSATGTDLNAVSQSVSVVGTPGMTVVPTYQSSDLQLTLGTLNTLSSNASTLIDTASTSATTIFTLGTASGTAYAFQLDPTSNSSPTFDGAGNKITIGVKAPTVGNAPTIGDVLNTIQSIINGTNVLVSGTVSTDNIFSTFTAELAGNVISLRNAGTNATDAQVYAQFTAVTDSINSVSMSSSGVTGFSSTTGATIGANTNGYYVSIQGDVNQRMQSILSLINDTASVGIDSSFTSVPQAILDALDMVTASPAQDSSGAPLNAITLQSNVKGMGGSISVLSNINGRGIPQAATYTNPSVNASIPSLISTYSAGTTVGSLGIANTFAVGAPFNNDIIGNTTSAIAQTKQVVISDALLSEGTVVSVGGQEFTITSSVTDPSTQIQLFTADVRQTLAEVVNIFNQSQDPLLRNLLWTTSQSSGNNNLQISSRVADSTLNGLTITFTDSSGSNTTSLTLEGGLTGGIDVSHVVANPSFVGALPADSVTATFAGTNKVNLSISVGGISYTGAVATVNPNTNDGIGERVVRLTSADLTGSIGLTLNNTYNSIQTVNSQADATAYAQNIENALGSIVFYQRRTVSAFSPDQTDTQLSGATAEYIGKNFSTMGIQNITVSSSAQSANKEAFITFTMSDGRVYQNKFANANEQLQSISAGQVLELNLVGSSDQNDKFILTFGSGVDLTSEGSVAALQSALSRAFKIGNSTMAIQVSPDPAQKRLTIAISAMDTANLGASGLNIVTMANALSTFSTLDTIANSLMGIANSVASGQASLIYALSGLNNSVESTTAAKLAFLAADIPTEVDTFQIETLKAQSAVFLLNQLERVLGQNLLSLIKGQ